MMVHDATELLFPILVFYRGFVLDIHQSLPEFARNNRLGLRSKPYEKARIVDMTGRLFPVIGVKRESMVWTIGMLDFNPEYRLSFDLGEPEQLTADELRGMIFDARRRERKASQRFKRLVNRAETIPDIIRAVWRGIYGPHGDYPGEYEC
jgi:hypothetical protein